MNKVQKAVGILPSQEILDLIDKKIITSDHDVDRDIIQPASIDLRLGNKAWRVPASFLPGKGNKVSSTIKQQTKLAFFAVKGAFGAGKNRILQDRGNND